MTDTTTPTTTTTTTTTTPEVEGFVQKIQTWRTTLTPTEQTMLDTILTTAQRTATTGRTTADVTAYTMTTTTNWTTLATWLTTTDARRHRPPQRRQHSRSPRTPDVARGRGDRWKHCRSPERVGARLAGLPAVGLHDDRSPGRGRMPNCWTTRGRASAYLAANGHRQRRPGGVLGRQPARVGGGVLRRAAARGGGHSAGRAQPGRLAGAHRAANAAQAHAAG